VSTKTGTRPFVGPHGSFWVVCRECDGRGWFWEHWDCMDNGCPTVECDRCHGNLGCWECVDDLCASLIDDENGW